LENFQRSKTWYQNTTITTQSTTNLPAFDHALHHKFPQPPSKTPAKGMVSPHTPRQKKIQFSHKTLA
jgi:hypothetical protein